MADCSVYRNEIPNTHGGGSHPGRCDANALWHDSKGRPVCYIHQDDKPTMTYPVESFVGVFVDKVCGS